ncbi:MAG: potassium-transporting ATPase subunit KdpA, partial [bacterium]
MNVTYVFQVAVLLAILTGLALLLGEYMAKVFEGKFNFAPENWIYKFLKIEKNKEMDWKTYTFSLLILNIIGIVFLFILQEIQYFMPLNPQKLASLRWDTALNTAVSFVTNTNWQAYSGEQTMSYLTQMLGMTVQNFLSAAIGIAAAIAFIRGFSRKTTTEIGNFWVDLTRSIVYILLPLSIIFSIFLVSQGVIQNFNPTLGVSSFPFFYGQVLLL